MHTYIYICLDTRDICTYLLRLSYAFILRSSLCVARCFNHFSQIECPWRLLLMVMLLLVLLVVFSLMQVFFLRFFFFFLLLFVFFFFLAAMLPFLFSPYRIVCQIASSSGVPCCRWWNLLFIPNCHYHSRKFSILRCCCRCFFCFCSCFAMCVIFF